MLLLKVSWSSWQFFLLRMPSLHSQNAHSGVTNNGFLLCARARVRVCVRVCVRACVCACVCVCVRAQPCLTLCDPMDCSLSGSSVHGVSHTGMSCRFFLQGIFLTQGSNLHLLQLLRWPVDSLPLAPPGSRLSYIPIPIIQIKDEHLTKL